MATILLIDDDNLMRAYGAAVLSSAGHNVVEVDSGEKGMARLRLGAIDLVVTDLVMPGQRGPETIVQMRKEYPRTKIIVVSGSPDSVPFRQAAALVGLRRILAKPFASRQLLDLVDEALCGE